MGVNKHRVDVLVRLVLSETNPLSHTAVVVSVPDVVVKCSSVSNLKAAFGGQTTFQH